MTPTSRGLKHFMASKGKSGSEVVLTPPWQRVPAFKLKRALHIRGDRCHVLGCLRTPEQLPKAKSLQRFSLSDPAGGLSLAKHSAGQETLLSPN